MRALEIRVYWGDSLLRAETRPLADYSVGHSVVGERPELVVATVVWLGTRRGIEAKLVPAAGCPIDWIDIGGLDSAGADVRRANQATTPSPIIPTASD